MSSFRATMVAKRASAIFLCILATLLLTPADAEEKPGRLSQPSLIVTPASSMAFSGPRGGPFSPARFEFRVSSTTGIVNYSIRTPSWLTASSTFGTTDTRGVTITLTVTANASRLSPGAYGPGVAFTNVSNGQGSTTRPAKLIIQGSSPPPATGQIAPNRGGFLLDDRGGYLLDGSTFTYSIVTAGNTSAGVYQNGSLVRTLWSNVPTTAGSHTYTWDGNDDSGKLLPAGSYEVRVLTSQAKYTWEGTVGNTSNQLSGGSVYHFEGNITSMGIVGKQAFFETGYNEGLPSCSKFSTANPNDKIGYTCKLYGIVDRVASDGINLYWTIEDETQNNNDNSITGDHYNWRSLSSFVAATRVSDNSDVPLSAGAPDGNNNEYPYAIDIIKNNPNGHGTGIAVQKNGSYLFVSHAWMNQLDVLNKTTAALVRTIPIQEVAGLAMDSSDSALWMIDANGGTRHVEKYTINADGTLSLAGSITGLSNPLALGVSPNGTTLLVADGGSSYQLKAYGTSAPYAQQWT